MTTKERHSGKSLLPQSGEHDVDPALDSTSSMMALPLTFPFLMEATVPNPRKEEQKPS